MAYLNKVFLIGNLTRDPELRMTPKGTAVCQFGLAVNRQYKDDSGATRRGMPTPESPSVSGGPLAVLPILHPRMCPCFDI